MPPNSTSDRPPRPSTPPRPRRTARPDRSDRGRTTCLQRLRGVEIRAGDFYAHGDEIVEKARAHAGGLEMALHGAIRPNAGAHELVDFLHLDDVAFETCDLGDAHDAALAVGQPRQLHDDA